MEGESRSERKQRDILAAARNLFTKEGYTSTGMELVARDAGVSTATLYAHFPSKAALFRAVIEHAIADLGTEVCQSVKARGDAKARMTAFAQAYARFYLDPTPRAIFRVVAAERRRFEDAAERLHDRCRAELGGAAIAIIRDLMASGELAVEKPAWAAGQLLGMIEHATLVYSLLAGDDARPTRPVDVLCDDAVATFLARYAVRETAA